MKHAIIVVTALLLVGCARFRTVQTDSRFKDGEMTTEIVTKATAYTLFSSRQLANWKASQTEKQQGASVGLDQQGATNVAGVAAAISEAATKAALQYLAPK